MIKDKQKKVKKQVPNDIPIIWVNIIDSFC